MQSRSDGLNYLPKQNKLVHSQKRSPTYAWNVWPDQWKIARGHGKAISTLLINLLLNEAATNASWLWAPSSVTSKKSPNVYEICPKIKDFDTLTKIA